MESYKISIITPGDDGYLNLWMRSGDRALAHIPNECMPLMKPGMRVNIHRNRFGMAVAYSFCGHLYFTIRPTIPESVRQFVANFKDIYSGSLDSLCFKYALNKSLRTLGMEATRNAVVNILLYNAAYKRYQAQL